MGRAAELARLRAAWTRAAHGHGGMVLVAGTQGMGKTRLAAELAREVHEQGGRVLYGRWEPSTRDPLQPFIQALPLTAVNDALRASMLEGAGWARLAPELAIVAAWLVISFVLAVRLFRWR